MKSVAISGRFLHRDGTPVLGQISFIPQKVWVEYGDVAYPTPAPTLWLDPDGRFETLLIRTDEDPTGPWYYTVKCPVGSWNFVIDSNGPLKLRNMIPKRRA
jgi:hypothetical protein